MTPVREILPGLYHWTAVHESIGREVSSYYVSESAVVVDPKLPEGGIDALPGRPEQIVLTIGLHRRDAPAVAEAFGARVRAPRPATERLSGRLEFEPFDDGEVVAPGITGLVIGEIAPDEGALHIAVGDGALAFADGLINYRSLGFVPDALLGDDPAAVKRGLTDAFARLLERDFDTLLFAHGEPIVSGGKAALRRFVESVSDR